MILRFTSALALAVVPISMLNKHIKMLLSTNTSYPLAFNNTLGIPVIEKDSTLENSAVKIIRDGDSFFIKRRSKYLCINNTDLILCETPTKFRLLESKFGKKMSYYNRCLTFDNQLSFRKCSSSKINQDFIFYLPSKTCNNFIKFPLSKNQKENAIAMDKKKAIEILDKKLDQAGVKNPKTKKTLGKIWSFGFKWPSFGIC